MNAILSLKDRILDNAVMFNLVRRVTDSRNQICDILGNELDTTANEKVLDVGCGLGNFSKATDGVYVGIDANKNFIRFAKRHYGNNKKSFFVVDAKKLNFKDKSFDKALFISMLHFFSDKESEKVLKEIMRVTKKYVVILDLLPTKRPFVKFLYNMNRGHYIRPLNKQLELIKKYFKIEKYNIYNFSMSSCSIISCKPFKKTWKSRL